MTEPTTDAALGSPPAAVIAHRLSTMRHAGRSCTRREPLDAGGLYAALWRSRTGDAAGASGHLADRTGARS